MAVDKLVDSSLLDANLESIANAIRTKGGTVADLTFPAGFVSAIGAISGGGADLSGLEIYVADFLADPPTMTAGVVDGFHRLLVP